MLTAALVALTGWVWRRLRGWMTGRGKPQVEAGKWPGLGPQTVTRLDPPANVVTGPHGTVELHRRRGYYQAVYRDGAGVVVREDAVICLEDALEWARERVG